MKKLVILLIVLFSPVIAFANVIGLVSYSEGTFLLPGNQKPETGFGQTLNNGDRIQSQSNSTVVISLRDGSQLILFGNSTIQLDFELKDTSNRIKLEQGNLWTLISNSRSRYRIELAGLAVESDGAALRLNVNSADHIGSINIGAGSATIQDSGGSRTYGAASQVLFRNSAIERVTVNNAHISLQSSLNEYYLPKSGQIPVVIRAAMPQGYSIQKPVPGYVISASPNLTVKSPAVSFYQEEIEIEVTALGTGTSDLYLVSDSVGDMPGFEGRLAIKILPMRDTKTMKIKTSRGIIKLKLAPLNN